MQLHARGIALALAAAAGAVLFPPALHADPNCCEQEARDGGARELLGKWQRPAMGDLEIPVKFNSTLAAALDGGAVGRNVMGNAADRMTCFTQAVDDWNAALAAGNHRVKLVLAADADAWSGDQWQVKCTDDVDATKSVYNARYTAAGAGGHHPDGTNAAATGHDHLAVSGQGAGWVESPEFRTDFADRLGECALNPPRAIDPPPADPPLISEADILWLTHFAPTAAACEHIPWDYRYAPMPAANHYDFYSVMLHELGHLLGLHHNDGNDVMAESLRPATRKSIGVNEKACLTKLYPAAAAQGDPCGPIAVEESTWSSVKVRYR